MTGNRTTPRYLVTLISNVGFHRPLISRVLESCFRTFPRDCTYQRRGATLTWEKSTLIKQRGGWLRRGGVGGGRHNMAATTLVVGHLWENPEVARVKRVLAQFPCPVARHIRPCAQ
jgi:hypothetical protein